MNFFEKNSEIISREFQELNYFDHFHKNSREKSGNMVEREPVGAYIGSGTEVDCR